MEQTPPDEVIAQYIEALQDSQWEVRRDAAQELGKIGPSAREAVPALTGALSDERKEVRLAALGALGAIGPAAREAIPALIVCGREKDEEIQEATSQAFAAIGQETIPALLAFLTESEQWPFKTVRPALLEMGDRAVPRLREALRTIEHLDVLREVLFILGQMGADAKDALPEITARLQDKRTCIRAADALKKIGRPAVPLLVETLQQKKAADLREVLGALRYIGPEATEAIPALTEALAEETLYKYAAAALRGISPPEAEEILKQHPPPAPPQ